MSIMIRTWTQKIALVVGSVFFAAVFIVVVSATILKHRAQHCDNICIRINHETGLFFLEEEDVYAAMNEYCGDSLEALTLTGDDFTSIESMLEQNPYVRNAEVYSNIKGSVNVEVEQKEPLIRVVNNKGVSYYLDEVGEMIPVSSNFTARVVVATGYIKEFDTSDSVQHALYVVGDYISQNEFWKAQFEQIYVTENGEFELVPKLGDHIIKLGKADNLKEKFERLMVFYKEVLKNVDAEDYKTVNLKYKDQIVCTKI